MRDSPRDPWKSTVSLLLELLNHPFFGWREVGLDRVQRTHKYPGSQVPAVTDDLGDGPGRPTDNAGCRSTEECRSTLRPVPA